jgi:hypothetical protein
LRSGTESGAGSVEIGPLTLDMDLLCWDEVGAAVAAAEALKRMGAVERYRGRRTCWVEEEREKVRRARGVSVFISLEEDERSAQEEKKMWKKSVNGIGRKGNIYLTAPDRQYFSDVGDRCLQGVC